MGQRVENSEKTDLSIKRIVSVQFLKTVDQAVKTGVVKNQREFATFIKENQTEFSKIKNPDDKRYVDIEMLYKAVNILGINANHVLVEGGDKTEKLQREGVIINGSSVKGNNNVVLTGQAVSNSGDVYYNVEKLVQSLPAKDKKAILAKISKLETQNAGLNNELAGLNSEMADLKKTIARYEREIEKDRKLIESQEKIIKIFENGMPNILKK